MARSTGLILIVALLVHGEAARASSSDDETVALAGEAAVYQDLCPGGLGSAECILSFYVEGEAARIMFDGMPGKGEPEGCTGGIQKYDGNGLICIRYDDGTGFCEFGYHFGEKRFVGSFHC
ncbi:MAG: hypothetical protein ACT4OK_03210 [Gemmobacter sp.]